MPNNVLAKCDDTSVVFLAANMPLMDRVLWTLLKLKLSLDFALYTKLYNYIKNEMGVLVKR